MPIITVTPRLEAQHQPHHTATKKKNLFKKNGKANHDHDPQTEAQHQPHHTATDFLESQKLRVRILVHLQHVSY